MAKGTESKNLLFTKLQEVYPEAFWEDQGKILRIPMDENGQRVEIKVSLTAAKTNLKTDEVANAFDNAAAAIPQVKPESTILEPTEEEKANVAKLIQSLGL